MTDEEMRCLAEKPRPIFDLELTRPDKVKSVCTKINEIEIRMDDGRRFQVFPHQDGLLFVRIDGKVLSMTPMNEFSVKFD